VARFQKQNKLNVTGAVDAATWQKLGAKVEPASPGPASPGSPPTRQK
jgi:peptidoglycan hydrolase-like protein with peptidoglycan-binding domain